MATSPTQERVRKLLNYNPETGEFTRRVSIKGRCAGSVAGNVALNGYVQVVVDGFRTYGHRLAFFYMTGEWPPHDVDHINRDRADNRWENLRLATRAENMWNVDVRNEGAHPHGDRWRAQIRTNGVKVHLGVFDTEAEARAAYREAANARPT